MSERQKPFIGLNADYRSGQGKGESVSYLFSGYYESVIKAGGIPVIIPPYENVDDLDPVLDTLDGFILTGGADLDPRRDGFMLHPSLHLMDERREEFDRALLNKIYERRLPLFGIGAGMQLINVYRGGTLFLHIAEDLPKALPHRDSMDPCHRHALIVEKDSLLDLVYGDNEIRVNSLHHMAVDDVAPGFLATARCPDSVIEAIESIQEDWFALGTQFHPESNSATAMDLRIFKEFINGILFRSDRFQSARAAILPMQKQGTFVRKSTGKKRRKEATPILLSTDAESSEPVAA